MSTRQLVARGYSREATSRETAAGRLHRIHQGVYAVGHPAVSRHGLCLAAVLACGEGALLSHLSAAWLWGLSTQFAPLVEVTAVTPRRGRASIRVHSAATLRDADRQTVERIPLTGVARTVLDVAGTRRYPAPERLLNRAERLDLLDVAAIDSLLDESAGQRGVRRLRRALDDFREPIFSRAGLERRFLRLVREAGLPRPSVNLFVCGYELDAYWPDLRFAVELDTYDYHGDPATFESDRKRQEDLKLSGIEMTRLTGRRIDREPATVAQRLRRLLLQRHRELHVPRQRQRHAD